MSKDKKEIFVLGIIGTTATGKDTAANFLKKYGFRKIVMSDFLRLEAEAKGIKTTRDNLRKIQHELRKEYGEEYLVSKVIESILTKNFSKSRVVIVGLRTPTDVQLVKKKLKAKIIFMDAKPELRFLRQKARQRTGFKKNFPAFLQEEALENAAFDFHLTKKMADFKIENNGEKEELYKKVKVILRKLKI